MDVSTRLKGVAYLGLGTYLRSAGFAWLRDRENRKAGFMGKPPAPAPIGRISAAVTHPWGATFRFENAELEVRFLAPDLARLTWQPGVLPVPYAIARDEWPVPEVACVEQDGRWHLNAAGLSVTVGPDGTIAYRDGAGATLREDEPPERMGEGWRHRARMRDDEHFYGLGMRTSRLDLRGGTFGLFNREPGGEYKEGDDPLYVTAPVYFGVHGSGSYLVFFENSWRGEVSFRERAEARFDGGALRIYLVPGPPAAAYDRFSELTGRPALPPRWALGFHQCRWSYGSEAEVRELVDGFRSRGLPLSAVHLDIDYMDGHRVFTVDPKRFPDLAALGRECDGKGVKLVAILDPGVKEDESLPLYREGVEKGLFCELPDGRKLRGPVWPGACAFPDFTKPATRAWWAAQYPRLLEQGISGAWHDMNEPSVFGAWGEATLPLSTRHDLDGRGGDHREAHNLYALLEARAGYEGMAAHRPGQRPWILSRSGWVGLQRYAWNWTGDSESSAASLRQSVRIALSMGLSGIPYTGPDIGGFGGAPSATLFTRWFQCASFLPFFRTHSAFFTPRREPWSFDDATLAVAKDFLHLRYRLMPYWYTLAWQASRTGAPLVRPMWWDRPGDSMLLGADDQFLAGDAFLVAPILDEEGGLRNLVLPPGRWYSMWQEGVFVDGPAIGQVEPVPGKIPVLVRAGSVVPMDEGGRFVLHAWAPAGGDGGGLLYDDAGDGAGPWRLERFRFVAQGGTLVLTRTFEGDYPLRAGSFDVQLHGARAGRVTVDGREVAIERERFQAGDFREVRFEGLGKI